MVKQIFIPSKLHLLLEHIKDLDNCAIIPFSSLSCSLPAPFSIAKTPSTNLNGYCKNPHISVSWLLVLISQMGVHLMLF